MSQDLKHQDPFKQFKEIQKETWKTFAMNEGMTTPPAAELVKFAKVNHGERVLDLACGTGVVAVTAAKIGAKASGLDITPELLHRARENASIAKLEVDFTEGDAEALPYEDGPLTWS